MRKNSMAIPCCDYDDEDDLEQNYTQRQNVSLVTARPHSALGPKGTDKVRDPSLDEGISFSESLTGYRWD